MAAMLHLQVRDVVLGKPRVAAQRERRTSERGTSRMSDSGFAFLLLTAGVEPRSRKDRVGVRYGQSERDVPRVAARNLGVTGALLAERWGRSTMQERERLKGNVRVCIDKLELLGARLFVFGARTVSPHYSH
ncbi:uncharacterized protein EKO05_0008737 [Ascochyta rabiei]|uniref:uncharacterized protein n=1 Tax=Didymella rabiei TaxID=5454 RepID=UPI002206DCA6|nr:uncharacterized protein EKO05_0008737 [Ascochyta rabiei]UPX18437.1 hypothetical protein EKO05_0008737 [Ascochyta rabiei]